MEYKSFSSEVKDINEADGYVEHYINAYLNEDHAKDISMPGCFNKTVKDNFKKIRVFKNHTDIIVGVPKKFEPADPYGLKAGTQFNMKTDEGKNMFWDIKMIHENNQDSDWSFGYEVVKRNEKDKRRIEEYKMYEYSALTTWGCNPLAITTGVKSLNATMEFLTKMYNLPFSDSRLIQVENILKSLSKEPDTSATLDAEPMLSFNSFGLITL